MKKTNIIWSCFIVLWLVVAISAFGLKSADIVRLKKVGISDATIQLMVREKVVETAAFSVQEIVDLKKAGLSEKTIQMVIREGSFLKDTAPIIYGKDVRSIEFTTANDIIALKNAGVSNEVIQAIITVVGESTDTDRRDAYRLLEDMQIRVDLRDGD
ncbi:MAG: hypothetical protein KJP06_07050 [Deltaproteobacteria bacterium]|nr:hypothetical protein [Deltaproteobacteria bacterium]